MDQKSPVVFLKTARDKNRICPLRNAGRQSPLFYREGADERFGKLCCCRRTIRRDNPPVGHNRLVNKHCAAGFHLAGRGRAVKTGYFFPFKDTGTGKHDGCQTDRSNHFGRRIEVFHDPAQELVIPEIRLGATASDNNDSVIGFGVHLFERQGGIDLCTQHPRAGPPPFRGDVVCDTSFL